MSIEAMKTALEAAYLEGFKDSAEGYNGEYPFRDHAGSPLKDRHWIERRDAYVRTVIEAAEKQEPFGYFKAEPFGWTDCAETDEGAIALYTTPPAAPVQEPPFRFRRFVAGSERAEDVVIERESTIEAAARKAARICPAAPMTVLVYDPNTKPRVLEPDYYVYNIDGVYRLADPQPTIRWGKK